jgi:hypothetical protein
MRVLLSVLFLIFASQAFAEEGFIYRWKEGGQWQYATIPPQGIEAEKIRVNAPQAPSQPSTVMNQVPAAASNNKPPVGLSPEELEKLRAGRKVTCEAAKKNLITLQSSPRVILQNPDGTEKTLSSEERKERIAQEEKTIAEFCDQ